MFQALICPSSEVCDYIVEYHIGCFVLGLLCVEVRVRINWGGIRVAGWSSASNPDTTLAEPHSNTNTQQTKNETANVVVQQYSRIILKMGILMPEKCCVSKK